MKLSKLLKIVTLSTALTAASTAHAAGGNGSGGGCTVEAPNGAVQLLDFAVHGRADFAGQGVQLPNTPRMKKLGLDVLDSQSLALAPVRAYAKQKVDAWKSRSLLAAQLSEAIAQFPLLVSPFVFNKVELTCPRRSAVGDIHPAILFTKDVGALVSVPTFNRLALAEQAGLLVHETLRMMQIQAENGVTDADLQNITDAIFFAAPGGIDLDRIEPNSAVAQAKGKREQMVAAVRSFCVREGMTDCNSYTSENIKAKFDDLDRLVSSRLKLAFDSGDARRIEAIREDQDLWADLMIEYNALVIDELDRSPAIAGATLQISQAFGVGMLTEIKMSHGLIEAFRKLWSQGLNSGALSNPGGYEFKAVRP